MGVFCRGLLPDNAAGHFGIWPAFTDAAIAPLAPLKFDKSLKQTRAIEIRP
jgi:hypothetical protein